MTAASFPRSQASPVPAEFAEMEPTRFCSVGGNGIKFYSNLRLTASVRCDQSAHCSARPWIATSNLELPRAAWKTPRCKSPCLAISFTLTAVCNPRSLLADSTQGQKLITCMESSSIHRKSRKTVQICRHRESKNNTVVSTHSRFHKAITSIRPKQCHGKKNLCSHDVEKNP